LLAKGEAFFALGLLTMQAVPDYRADKTENVSDSGRDYDQRNRCQRIKWFNEVNRLDHVRPENEIKDRLRPADENKK
jgi:hypothetical protein